MNARLIIVGGKANASEVELSLPSVIGRSREADLTVGHPMVSRRHCELYEEEGLLKIRDLGSLNGTFVGQTQIRHAELYPDSEFTVGPLTFRVEYDYAGTAPCDGGICDAMPAATSLVPDDPLSESAETERRAKEESAECVQLKQKTAERRDDAEIDDDILLQSDG